MNLHTWYLIKFYLNTFYLNIFYFCNINFIKVYNFDIFFLFLISYWYKFFFTIVHILLQDTL